MNVPFVDTSHALSAAERLLVERLGLTHPDPAADNVLPFDREKYGTPPTTIEALMFGLRRGLSCLEDPGHRDRLRRCDEDAITQVAARLLALGWPKDDVATLIEAWQAVGGGQS
jgi:hypothetical protein